MIKRKRLFKFLPIVFSVISVFGVFGCKNASPLYPYVVKARTDIFYAESQNFKLKTYLYFEKQDSSSEENVSYLSFMLYPQKDSPSAELYMDDGDFLKKADFVCDPLNDCLKATVEVENFSQKTFSVKIITPGNSEEFTLKSVLPADTVCLNDALNFILEKQPSFIGNYYEKGVNGQKGVFQGEIEARIMVKDDKPYWYFGFTNKDGNLKAFLIDATHCELLAVREIM